MEITEKEYEVPILITARMDGGATAGRRFFYNVVLSITIFLVEIL